MNLVQASDAARLSGLTSHQLREWCGRRAVVLPDVPAAGRGRHALFSWQTIIALRVLNELHSQFGVEVIAWRQAIARCQDLLRSRAFPSLWGGVIVFPSAASAMLTYDWKSRGENACLLVGLDPHLKALATDISAPPDQQLPLFAALAVQS
jgi:hypothetical protein